MLSTQNVIRESCVFLFAVKPRREKGAHSLKEKTGLEGQAIKGGQRLGEHNTNSEGNVLTGG